MALIRTIDDARKFVRLERLSNNAFLPDFEAVEMLHLIPVIGENLYAKLNEEFDTLKTDGGTYGKCLRACQRMIAPLGFANELGTIQSVITDGGIRTPETANMTAAHAWEFKQLKSDLLNKAAQGMEILLKFLFDNSIDEWNESNQAAFFKKLSIKTATDFSKYYKLLDPFRTYFLLSPIISMVQERYLVPIIGRQLLSWISDRQDAIITVDGQSVDIMLHFKSAVACFTVKHACKQLSVRITDSGLTVLASGSSDDLENTGRSNASIYSYESLIKEMESQGQRWLSDLSRFLKGAHEGTFTNDFGDEFDQYFLLSPLAPGELSPQIDTKNDQRKIFVLGG